MIVLHPGNRVLAYRGDTAIQSNVYIYQTPIIIIVLFFIYLQPPSNSTMMAACSPSTLAETI
jgi:hypothetical protein